MQNLIPQAGKAATRTILAVLSDTHGGHKLGLMNPTVTLQAEDESGNLVPYQPTPTASQDYLWSLYKDCLAQVQNIAQDSPVVAIHNGDIAQGNRFMSELVSTRMADQIIIGAANLRPVVEMENLSALRFAVGTEAHVFGEGSAEILVADSLTKEFHHKDIQVVHHGLCEVGGASVDYAHHGPPKGARSWLTGNVARYYLQSLMLEALAGGEVPPRLVFRGHYHGWICETVTLTFGDKEYVSTLIVTPSFCMMGEHGHKATRSIGTITNGMAAVEIDNGNVVKIHRLARTLDIRTKERL